MAKFPLIGPSYSSQSVNADCQSTINLYPEVIESGAGNSQIVLYPAPGLKAFADLTPITPPPVTCTPSVFNLSGPNSAIQSGNSVITTISSIVNAFKVGDVIFVEVSTTDFNAPDNASLLIEDSLGTSFSEIGSRLQAADGLSQQIYKGVVPQNLGAGSSYTYTVTYNHDAGTVQGAILPLAVRCIDPTVLQFSQGLVIAPGGPTIYSGAPITTTSINFVLSFLVSVEPTTVQPDYQVGVTTGGPSGFFISYHVVGADIHSPPGTYGGSYQTIFGSPHEVCIKNVSFGFEA